MPLTLQDLASRGLLDELVAVFSSREEAAALLESIGYPRARLPELTSPVEFWHKAAAAIASGSTAGGLEGLLSAAAEIYPYNQSFASWRREKTEFGTRAETGSSLLVSGSFDLHRLIDRTREIARSRELGRVELGVVTRWRCQIRLPDATAEQAFDVGQELERGGEAAQASVVPNEFRDYLLGTLRIEGFDTGRYELSSVPVSTRVRDLARATMRQYDESAWPQDRSGQARPAVVDHIDPESGAYRRLDPDATLHESRVEDGATLHVAPESTAGGGGDSERLLFARSGAGGGPPGTGGGDGGSGPPDEPLPEPRRRYLSAWFPERIRLGHRVPLLVRVTLSPDSLDSAPLRPLPVPQRGIEVTLRTEVQGFELLSSGTFALRITSQRDSEWAVFDLKAVRQGVHTLRISAFYRASYLGTLPLQVTVDERLDTGPHTDRQSPILPRRREPGEVTLLIHFDESQRVYRYQLIDDTVGGLEEALSKPLRRTPYAMVEGLVGELNQLARGELGFSARQTRAWLKGKGIELWQELIPEALQIQFRERRDKIRRMFILSAGDPIPWEVLYPFGNGTTDQGFLAEQFPVARWEYGEAPTNTLRAGRAGLILPAGSPDSATEEIRTVQQLLERRRIAVDGPLCEFDDLLALFDKAAFHLLHFACHNSFAPDSPTTSSIQMGKAPFQPTFLAEHQQRFRATAPLVFVNACRTDGQAPLYTRLAGWARSFLRAGCGAFVGTQWEVRDGPARTFAEVFYRSLTAGRLNLGEAMGAARQAIKDEPGDPTWLAYTFYGDPAATLGEEEPA